MKSKKIIIAVVAILVVLGGTFAGLWFFTDVFNFMKKPEDVFENQVDKAVSKIFNLESQNVKFSNYSDFLKEYKEVSKDTAEKSVKSKVNLSANLKISELDSDVQKIINKSKITIESSTDVDNNRTQNVVGLYSGNSEVLTLDLVTNDTTLGVGCKSLSDKYYTVKVEDLIDYLKKNYKNQIDVSELEEISDMFSSMKDAKIDPYELLYISDEDLKHLDETYLDAYKTLISDKCYSTENKVEVKVDGKDVTTTAYYLTLTGEDFYNLVDGFGKLLKDDDVITRIITEKANMVLEAMDQSKIKEKDVKEAINSLVDELVDSIEDAKDSNEAIQIAIYSDKNAPVRVDLNLLEDADKKDEKETVASIEYADSKNIIKLYQNGKEFVTLVNNYTKNTDTEKEGTIDVKYMGTSVGSLKYELVDKEKESKLYLEVSVPMADLSAKVDISTKGNYKDGEVEFDGTISFSYEKEAAEIKFDGTVEFGDVSVPELTSKNSIDVLKLSEKDSQAEAQKLLKKASEVLPSRLKLIGIDVKAEDIYTEPKVEVPAETTTTTTDAENKSADENTENKEENKDENKDAA